MDEGYVVVVGSAGIDIKGRPFGELHWESSNIGVVRNSVGGVARNIAENLACLEVPTVLLTALGRDVEGERVFAHCLDHDIDCKHLLMINGARTGTYLSMLKPNGELLTAIGDFDIMHQVNSAYLLENEEVLAESDMVVIDATLDEAALHTLFEIAERHWLRVCADPTTPILAAKIRPYLNQLHLVVPNAIETAVLCDLPGPVRDREAGIAAARQLVNLGAQIAVVTMGEQGLAYADGSGGGVIRSVTTQVVDSTGAGDALTGAVIFGLLNDVPLDEA
ncbi:MAG: ribokinase, partial [Anaerolineae bacterium]|nr:ribokinase [Anaerolineae bacterium]